MTDNKTVIDIDGTKQREQNQENILEALRIMQEQNPGKKLKLIPIDETPEQQKEFLENLVKERRENLQNQGMTEAEAREQCTLIAKDKCLELSKRLLAQLVQSRGYVARDENEELTLYGLPANYRHLILKLVAIAIDSELIGADWWLMFNRVLWTSQAARQNVGLLFQATGFIPNAEVQEIQKIVIEE